MKRFLHLLTGICTLALALQACTKSPAENPGRTDDPGNDEQNSKVTLTLSTPRTRTTLVSETYVHWSEEDIVQINGTNLPVIPDPNDPTRATISNVDTAEEYVALYSPDNGGYIPEREVVEAYFRPEVPHTPDSFYTTGGNPMVAYSTSTSLEFKTATQIMITPLGYRFRIVRNIVTNFHQPKSTLLLLVSAYVGDDWHRIYDYALTHDFRFLSYGDSSVLMR